VYANNGKEARRLLAEYVSQAKSKREVSATKAVVTRRENRVKRVVRAYRTVDTQRPVDEERLKDNVRKNEDPEFTKLLNRVKDDRELGMELQYRAMIIGPDAKVLSGAFYHGRSAT
jgi:F0F1-type ATP synthase membrane subunit b/b'